MSEASREEVEVLYRNSACWIFQRTDRGYPSSSIQGDTLALLEGRIVNVREKVRKNELDDEFEYDLEYVQESLSYLWDVYQRFGLKEGLFKPKP